MQLIANVPLKILILCILPMRATRPDIDSTQGKKEDLILNETLSDLVECDGQNNNVSLSRNFSHTNILEDYLGEFVNLDDDALRNFIHTDILEDYLGEFSDLDDDCNQTIEPTVNMPEIKTERRKRSSELIHGNTQSQPSVKRRRREQNIQEIYSEEHLFGYMAEFDHIWSNRFLFSKKDFKIKKYRSTFKSNKSIFIREFYSKKQLRNLNSDLFLGLDEIIEMNFEKLEVYILKELLLNMLR